MRMVGVKGFGVRALGELTIRMVGVKGFGVRALGELTMRMVGEIALAGTERRIGCTRRGTFFMGDLRGDFGLADKDGTATIMGCTRRCTFFKGDLRGVGGRLTEGRLTEDRRWDDVVRCAAFSLFPVAFSRASRASLAASASASIRCCIRANSLSLMSGMASGTS